MSYLPLEILGADASTVFLYWIIVAIVVGLVIGWIVRTKSDTLNGVVSSIGAIILMFVPCSLFGIGAQYARDNHVGAQIAEYYGIALSRTQQKELGYPGERPGSEERTYGSTILESKGGKQKVIVLTGKEGKLQLKSGEELKELPRKDQDR